MKTRKPKEEKPLTVKAALLEAAAWNRSDLRGIDDITPDAAMLQARAVVLGRALVEYRAEREEARALSRQIAAFDRRCSREEYTDTGEAWELLTAARKLLRRIGK